MDWRNDVNKLPAFKYTESSFSLARFLCVLKGYSDVLRT